MTPIPLLVSTGLAAARCGAPPAAAPGAATFGDLLPPPVRPVPPRKGDAGGGKDLPAIAAPDEDEGEDEAAAAAAWIGTPVLPVPCPAVPVAAGELVRGGTGGSVTTMPGGGDDIRGFLPAEGAAPAPARSLLPAAQKPDTPGATGESGGGAVDVAPAPPAGARLTAPVPADVDAPGEAAATPRGASESPPGPPDRKAPPRVAGSAPAVALAPAAPRVAPAGEVFAAAIRQAVREERRPLASDGAMPLVPAADLAPQAVPAAGNARQPALDMGGETWPGRMIERIEALRDAADANDASIRLIPDRLGAIDVSLKRDGDGIEVRLHAHQAETRALLAEAQPKLVEMGEARGLRLSAQTDGGAGGGPPQQQRPPAPSAAPAAPAAPRHGAAERADPDEQRIA